MIGKVKKAKLYIFVGRLAKPHTVELGTSRLKGDGTNGNPLNILITYSISSMTINLITRFQHNLHFNWNIDHVKKEYRAEWVNTDHIKEQIKNLFRYHTTYRNK